MFKAFIFLKRCDTILNFPEKPDTEPEENWDETHPSVPYINDSEHLPLLRHWTPAAPVIHLLMY